MGRVLRLPRNTQGLDLAIGDIHGCFTPAYKGLTKAKFNAAQGDRLISVGDLVDRGPESPESYGFIHREAVFVHRGNHEDAILALLGSDKSYHKFTPEQLENLRNAPSMAWHKELNEREREQIIEAFEALPLMIEVETDIGLVGFVHGNVPIGMSWDELRAAVEADDRDVIENMLYGRERILQEYDAGVEGVARVFLGHTARDQIKQLGNCFYIDQGYVFKDWPEPNNSYAVELTDQHFTIAQIDLPDTFYAAARPIEAEDDRVHVIARRPQRAEAANDRSYDASPEAAA